MAVREVASKYTRDASKGEDRKGECCKTCKSWKKGAVEVKDKMVPVMQCESKQRFPKAGAAVEPPNGWCGWWEK